MAVDLVSLVTQSLTPDTVRKLSSSIGADGNQVQTALGAAVPALLAGLAGTATHGGAQKVADAVNQQSGALDQLTSALGSGATGLADTGGKMLGSLIGSSGQNAIASALAKFSGMGQGVASALIGTLAPIVLGVIGKQAGPRGFDASSVKELFETQKPNIANAMPTRFAGLLQDNGILDAVSDTTSYATNYATNTARTATASTARATREAVAPVRSSSNWLYWLIPLLILGGFFWWLATRGQPETVNVPPASTTVTTTPPASTNVTVAPDLMINGVDVGDAITTSMGTLRTTLEGVTDAASAQAALPQLATVTADIDRVTNAMSSATAEQRAAVASMASPLVTGLQTLFDRVVGIPGVSAILAPAINGIKDKITAWTTA